MSRLWTCSVPRVATHTLPVRLKSRLRARPCATGAQLSLAAMKAAVAVAHGKGVRVGTHAMSTAATSLAADAGVDILVHTPSTSPSPVGAMCRVCRGRRVPDDHAP